MILRPYRVINHWQKLLTFFYSVYGTISFRLGKVLLDQYILNFEYVTRWISVLSYFLS